MKTDFGFFIAADPELCTGCKACELACFSAHNSSAPGKTMGSLASFVTPNLHVVRTAGGWSLATCRHCEDAPCLNVCQPKAITRRGHEVIVDPALCTGCSDCIPVCPFGAISIAPRRDSASQNHGSMAAQKCDLCQGSADGPACVRACPNGALRLVDPESERRQKGVQAVETLIALSKL